MTFQYKKPDPLDVAPVPLQTQKPTGFAENFDAARLSMTMNDTSISEYNALEQVWQPIVDELNQGKGTLDSDKFINPAFAYAVSIFNEEGQENAYGQYTKKIYDALEGDEQYANLRGTFTNESIFEQAAELARSAKEDYMKVNSNADGYGSTGGFAGGFVGAIDDPILVSSMLIGGARGLWQMAFQEAALGAGSEAIIQTKVAEWYKKTGQEYTDEQFWTAVKYGAGFGFASPFALRGLGKGLSVAGEGVMLSAKQLKEGISSLKQAGVKTTPEGRILEDLAEDLEVHEQSNPLEKPNMPKSASEHDARQAAADIAVERNQAPDIPNEPQTAPRPLLRPEDADNLDGQISVFDPDEIGVDAELFQFKAGGDEFGVTERLQGVTEWDPIAAGQIVVFEFADGRKFIADGHQRLGLAKRIKSQDPSQKIQILGHVLRESDGITPEMARVIAAVKNIKEGTGTAIDAAKILRDAPDKAGELPPQSKLVQHARGLVMLTDQAFGAIINNVIPSNYGGIVGRLIPDDPKMQDAAIALLSKLGPANEFQAESIIRQMLDAGAETRTQDSLFGEEIITESFFLERAKILDQAIKSMRQDKAAFASLVRNQDRLEAEGNQLAKEANQRRAENDSQAIGLIQALANRKGPLSEALTAAARTARETGSYGQPTGGFVEAVRRAIEDGDFDRLAAGDVGRTFNDTAEVGPRATEPEPDVELFSDPNGPDTARQADQLEADVRGEEVVRDVPPERTEGFQQDQELLQDFKNLLDQGADEDTLFTHPAAVKAIEAAEAILPTNKMEGFGTDAWRAERQFDFDGETVTGYDEALFRHFEASTTLAYRELGLDVPSAPVLYEGKAVILVGPPAAGKSTLANPIAVRLKAAIPDSDEFKKTLPEYQGGLGAAAVHAESSSMAKELVAASAQSKVNMVIPKVGEDAPSIEKLRKQLKDEGYDVALINMDVSYENALIRMFKRFVSKGRLIGADYMKSIGNRPTQTYNDIKGNFDRYVDIDNNGGKEIGPRIKEDNYGGPEIAEAISPARPAEVQLEPGRADGGRADGEPPAVSRPSEPVGRAAEAEAERGVGFGILAKVEAEIAREAAELEIPIGSTIDEAGQEVAVTMTRKQILDDIDQDKKMLDRLRGCVK